MIEVEGVSVRYRRDVVALDDVTVTVPSGSVTGLIGMNGAGKSTLMKVITGITRPERGFVRLGGMDTRTARRRGLVSYVPQSEVIDADFPISVREVVMMGRYGKQGLTRRIRRSDRAAVDEALARVDLTALADRQIGQLSGGQRKRTFVARGIAQDADILLLDEPFAGVDKGSEGTIVSLLRDLAASGRTILVSTHDLHALPELADDAVLLNRRVLFSGPVDEALEPDTLALAFGLDPRERRRMSLIEIFIEPLQYGFMQRAMITTVLAAVVCALLSCWLVLIGWSLMGDAVSHAVLPGIVLAYIVGVPFAVGALVFGVLAVTLIGVVSGTTRVKEDAAIGIVFTTLFAFGLVLVSVTPSQTDLSHILFGNVLGVSPEDLVQVAVIALIAGIMLVLKRRDLTLYAFDPSHAFAIGLSPRLLGAVLLGLLAMTAVVALQVVGVILVVAMLIIPGATAQLLTRRFARMLLLAPVIATVCAVGGIYLSYWVDASPGGMVVVTQGAVFAVVYGASLVAGRRRRRQALSSDRTGIAPVL